MIKIKSSALMIALIMGVVLSGILVGIVLTLSQHTKSSGQAREGKTAYRAALSGIEDGLIRMKYASAENKLFNLYGSYKDLEILTANENSVDILYDLTFKMDSISIGEKLTNSDANVHSWKNNAENALKQGAFPALSDDLIDIDLTYLLNVSESGLSSVEIFYSNPFIKGDNGQYTQAPFSGLSPSPFSAVSIKLIDQSELGEEQLKFEKINNVRSNNKIQVENLSSCEGENNFTSKMKQCHLQIKPQVAVIENAVDRAANRLSGEGIAGENKYIFFMIRAKDKNGKLIEPSGDKPGTITIESIGKAGEAVRKIQAKLDASGKYIGLLDFGIYCGTKCNMPSVRVPE